jgi:alkylation response protein AidB-like acyl-CoA dehydrogenase
METQTIARAIPGGGFLINPADPSQIYTPEDFNEEQHMIMQMCQEFLDKEVLPHLIELDDKKEDSCSRSWTRPGALGLLGAAFPEEYGGLGKDFVTATLVNEGLGGGHSFAVAMAAHNGIGSLPILYFGTPEQKQKIHAQARYRRDEGRICPH